MTGIIEQQQRKAVALAQTSEIIDEMQATTERLQAARGDLLLPDEDVLVCQVEALALAVARQETAFNHAIDQVLAAQEGELERLRERVDELETAAGGGK